MKKRLEVSILDLTRRYRRRQFERRVFAASLSGVDTTFYDRYGKQMPPSGR